nr:hypothetical protein [Salinirubrum litoreum]
MDDDGDSDGDGGSGVDDTDPEAVTADDPEEIATDEPEAVGFGRQGWLLVGVVVLTFLVIPVVVYLYPAAVGGNSVPFLVGLIALPMLPAVLLGLTAVWTMTAAAGDAGAVDDERGAD